MRAGGRAAASRAVRPRGAVWHVCAAHVAAWLRRCVAASCTLPGCVDASLRPVHCLASSMRRCVLYVRFPLCDAALGAPVLREGVQRRSHRGVHADRPRRVQLGRARKGGPPGWLTHRRTARSEAWWWRSQRRSPRSGCAITSVPLVIRATRSCGDLNPASWDECSCWRPCARRREERRVRASRCSLCPCVWACAGLGGHDRPLQRVRWVVIRRHPPNRTHDGLV